MKFCAGYLLEETSMRENSKDPEGLLDLSYPK